MNDLDKIKYIKKQVFSKVIEGEKGILEYKDVFGNIQYFLINEIRGGKMYGIAIEKKSYNFLDLKEFVKRDFKVSHFKTIEDSVGEE